MAARKDTVRRTGRSGPIWPCYEVVRRVSRFVVDEVILSIYFGAAVCSLLKSTTRHLAHIWELFTHIWKRFNGDSSVSCVRIHFNPLSATVAELRLFDKENNFLLYSHIGDVMAATDDVIIMPIRSKMVFFSSSSYTDHFFSYNNNLSSTIFSPQPFKNACQIFEKFQNIGA